VTLLTHWEEITLVASVSFVWHARFKEAREDTGISWDQWRDSANLLMNKGLVDYRGTPTPAGMERARGLRMDYVERKVISEN
jgi:hypothetical protein